MISLKKCPWCHSSPILVQEPLWTGSHGYYGCYEYYVKCINCCAIAPNGKFNSVYQSEELARSKAIERWNERNENCKCSY